jgi:hypothetical protein
LASKACTVRNIIEIFFVAIFKEDYPLMAITGQILPRYFDKYFGSLAVFQDFSPHC